MDSSNRPVIPLFVDGTCIYCNRIVSFILRHDREGVFHFAHLQGALARAVLARHGLVPDIDTIYAVANYRAPNERVLTDGEVGRLVWPKLFRSAFVLRFVPLFVLNWQYRMFAKIRYRIFGQAPACIVPSQAERARFMDSAAATCE